MSDSEDDLGFFAEADKFFHIYHPMEFSDSVPLGCRMPIQYLEGKLRETDRQAEKNFQIFLQRMDELTKRVAALEKKPDKNPA